MNSFLLFGVLTSVPILVKIDQEMRPWECSQTDRQTDTHTHRHTHTDANRFYNLSHAICYSCGTDNYIISPPFPFSRLTILGRLKLRDVNKWHNQKHSGGNCGTSFYGQPKPHLLQLETFLHCLVLSWRALQACWLTFSISCSIFFHSLCLNPLSK